MTTINDVVLKKTKDTKGYLYGIYGDDAELRVFYILSVVDGDSNPDFAYFKLHYKCFAFDPDTFYGDMYSEVKEACLRYGFEFSWTNCETCGLKELLKSLRTEVSLINMSNKRLKQSDKEEDK